MSTSSSSVRLIQAEPAAAPSDPDERPYAPPPLRERGDELVRAIAWHGAAGGLAPSPVVPPLPLGDVVKVGDDQAVAYVPERKGTWRTAWVDPNGEAIALGRLDAHGWVQVDERLGGGRLLQSALEKVAAQHFTAGELDALPAKERDRRLAALIADARSPCQVVAGSQDIALFLDGTSNCRPDRTNISEMYDAFQGTKFYYGGVGNRIDYAGLKEQAGLGFGKEFDAIIDRGLADLAEHWKPGMRIHLYGFSRGAAEAIELARRLQEKGIEVVGVPGLQHPDVEMLGVFDPVYSVGGPGQDSKMVRSTEQGRAGNYVNVELPTNLKHVRALYAQHEERTWFPATRLHKIEGATIDFVDAKIPGVHCDDGGHIENNRMIAQLARHWMEKECGDGDRFGGGCVLAESEFRAKTSLAALPEWKFGGYGTQAEDGANVAYQVNRAARVAEVTLVPAMIPMGGPLPNQPPLAHMPRDLSWVQGSVVEDPDLAAWFARPKREVETGWKPTR